MRSTNNKKKSHFTQKIVMILIIGLLTSTILINVSAKHKEFEVEEFQEKFTITHNKIQAIDFTFQEGKRLEIIYTIQVEGELPIDIWFINEDNYMLLSGGAQFLYFIDGTEQKTSYAKKVVTLTKHDNYKLVITNYYNNQTIDVNVKGEIRTFEENTEENSLNFSQILFYSLIVITTVFIILTIVLSLKLRRSNQNKVLKSNKKSTKKINTNKPKKNKSKNKNKDSGKKTKNKKPKETNSKNIKKETKTNSNSPGYCGYCGEAASTLFCKNCGYKV